MSNTLKVKRGTNLSNAGTPAAGELIYKSDTNQLFVGDGSTAATSLSPIGGSASGDIEGVTAGTGLSGGGTSGTVSLAVDLSELTDMTASVNSSQDELIILDNGADRRKLISEIPLSAFNNDSGFITTDTTLSTEQVQDIAGTMFSSNTETGINVSYVDGDGTVDLVVDYLPATDDRDVKPSAITTSGQKQVRAYFATLEGLTGSSGNDYQDLLVLDTYSDGTGGDVNALAFDKSEQKIRHYLADQSDTTWGTAKVLAYEDTFTAGTGLDLSGTTFSVDVSDFMTNGSNNRVLTATGTDGINAESSLTFNGSLLTNTGDIKIAAGSLGVNTNANSANGRIAATSHIEAGVGSGAIGLTINDGGGNSNVTFNHTGKVPEQNGQAARIEVNTDATSSEGLMYFEVSSADVTAGSSVTLTNAMNLAHDYMDIPYRLRHIGDDDTYLQFDNNRIRIYAGGGLFLDSNNTYLTSSGILDQDDMSSNSATAVASQQSIKAYVDAEVAGIVNSAPSALNTLDELAAALGDDANFATTTSTSLGNRLRVDTASQGLTGTQQANAITNLGITATKAELNYVDGVTSAIQTQLNSKLDTAGTGIDISSTTVSVDVSDFMSNGSNNRIVTATGADAMNAEANLLFSGSTLEINNSGDWSYILNNTNSGGLRLGTKDSGGTLAYQIELSNTGNYVKLNENTTVTGKVEASGKLKSTMTGGFTIGNVAGEDRIQNSSNSFSFLTDGNGYADMTFGTVTAGTWNGSVIASAYLDSDTAHLSGSQTFSGAKTFTGRLTISDAGADGLHLNQDTGATTNSNRIFLTGNSGSCIMQESDDLSFRSGATAGSSSGTERFKVNSSGATAVGNFTATGNAFVNFGLVVNEGSNDADFRVEGNGNANLIRTDAANDYVGIATGNPYERLYVECEDATSPGIVSNPAATNGAIAYAIGYGDANRDYLNTWGMAYSSAANVFGYGVKPSTSSDEAFINSADNSNFTRGALYFDNELKFFNAGATTGTIDTAITMTERFRVDSSGNIKMTGTIDSFSANLTLRRAASDNDRIVIEADQHSHYVNGTKRLETKADGIFVNGISKASSYVQVESSGTQLRLYNSAWGNATTHDVIHNGYGTNLGDYVYLKTSGNSASTHGMVLSTDNYFFWGRTDIETGAVSNSATAPIADVCMRVDASGNALFDGDVVAYSTTIASDARLKENVKDLNYGLKDVLDIRPVSFDWIDKRNGQHDIGVIAQEIEKIIPEVVVEVDTLNSEDTHKTVDYAKLTSVLIKAVQELKAEVEELKK